MDKCYNNSSTVTQGVSLCIPRLSGDTEKSDILNKFDKLGIGKVFKIDMIWKISDKGEKFYSAFIHIHWNASDLSKYIIDRVTSGKDVKIIYDGFLFWKIFLNKSLASASVYKNNDNKRFGYNSKLNPIESGSESSRTWERNSKIM
jgi:hypothetical protein